MQKLEIILPDQISRNVPMKNLVYGGMTCISAVSCNVLNPAYVTDLSSTSTFLVTKQAYKLPLDAWWNFGFAADTVAGGHRLAPCINLHVRMCAPAEYK